MDHDAVGADVDPAVVGVARDIERAGADVAAAVARVPARRWEDGHVDVVAAPHVLEDGAIADLDGGQGLHAADLLPPGIRDFDPRQSEG